jgi:outer membrane protein assembly factor BamB
MGSFSGFPVVADGQVYAADARGGWRHSMRERPHRRETDTDARISAGVGLAEGRVLVGTSQAQVIALDQEKGNVLWRAGVPPRLGSPRVLAG